MSSVVISGDTSGTVTLAAPAVAGTTTLTLPATTGTVIISDGSGNIQFNSGYGSVATAYGCRAWVNFNGTTATPSTIRASGNVTSVTKNSTGNYTINFTTAMSDANYAVKGIASSGTRFSFVALSSTAQTTSAVSIVVYGDDGSLQDCAQVHVSIVR